MDDDENQSSAVKLAVVHTDITYIKEKLNAVDEKVSKCYITKEEFKPIRNIIYGTVLLILVTVVGAVLALVLQAKTP